MQTPPIDIVAEEFPSKVTASYSNAVRAREAAVTLRQWSDVDPRQVRLVSPGDSAVAPKLQPEAEAIERTFYRTHLAFGLAGLGVGSGAAIAAVSWGPIAISASPLLAGLALVWVCTLSSLILAGAVTLRMDHDGVFSHLLQARSKGQTTVIAHARSAAEKRRFRTHLEASASSVASTL